VENIGGFNKLKIIGLDQSFLKESLVDITRIISIQESRE